MYVSQKLQPSMWLPPKVYEAIPGSADSVAPEYYTADQLSRVPSGRISDVSEAVALEAALRAGTYSIDSEEAEDPGELEAELRKITSSAFIYLRSLENDPSRRIFTKLIQAGIELSQHDHHLISVFGGAVVACALTGSVSAYRNPFSGSGHLVYGGEVILKDVKKASQAANLNGIAEHIVRFQCDPEATDGALLLDHIVVSEGAYKLPEGGYATLSDHHRIALHRDGNTATISAGCSRVKHKVEPTLSEHNTVDALRYVGEPEAHQERSFYSGLLFLLKHVVKPPAIGGMLK